MIGLAMHRCFTCKKAFPDAYALVKWTPSSGQR